MVNSFKIFRLWICSMLEKFVLILLLLVVTCNVGAAPRQIVQSSGAPRLNLKYCDEKRSFA